MAVIYREVTAEDREFLDSRQLDWAQLRQGFLRHLDAHVKQRYWDIYQRYIGAYNLDFNCQACLVNMLTPLLRWYDKLPPVKVEAPEQKTKTITTKPSKK